MIKHFIILSSSYSSGTRIAMHYIIGDEMDADLLIEEVRTIKKECGDTVSISTHFIETDSARWDSVIEKDAFFEDVYVVESLVEFVNLITLDRKLKGIDIAKYILSVLEGCTHLKLEKLVYYCYADYLCKYEKRLFEDSIYAYKYGPIIKSVYEEYKGRKEISKTSDDSRISIKYDRMPARSRILFAEDGAQKISSIDDTLANYSGYTAADLVSLTHIPGSPWDEVWNPNVRKEITDSLIIARHCIECV